MLKVRAFENNNEKIIPISDITGSVNRERHIFNIPADIVGDTITLDFTPLINSEVIFLNGLAMTEGATYDYTRIGAVVTFNHSVLTNSGHVLVNYSY